MTADRTMLRRRTLLAMAVSALGLAGSARADLVDPRVPDLVDLKVVDRETGQPLQVWRHDGRLFVAGQPGARYSLRVTNHTDGRVLVVMSVDGVNIADRRDGRLRPDAAMCSAPIEVLRRERLAQVRHRGRRLHLRAACRNPTPPAPAGRATSASSASPPSRSGSPPPVGRRRPAAAAPPRRRMTSASRGHGRRRARLAPARRRRAWRRRRSRIRVAGGHSRRRRPRAARPSRPPGGRRPTPARREAGHRRTARANGRWSPPCPSSGRRPIRSSSARSNTTPTTTWSPAA